MADYFKDNEGEAFKQNEFTFKLTLTGPSGPLADDYAYMKYDRDGKVLPNGGGVLSWETIANGEDFTLKDGEYIRSQMNGTTVFTEQHSAMSYIMVQT